MSKAKLLTYVALGGLGYYLWHRSAQNKTAAAHAAAAAAAAASPITSAPTDSMMPGIMSGALLGLADDAPRQHKIRHLKQINQLPQRVAGHSHFKVLR